jgi:hypothetical protein
MRGLELVAMGFGEIISDADAQRMSGITQPTGFGTSINALDHPFVDLRCVFAHGLADPKMKLGDYAELFAQVLRSEVCAIGPD